MFIKYQILFWDLEDSNYGIKGAEFICVFIKALLRTNKEKFTPVFLPGESHRQRSLAGYSPESCKELEMTKAT